MAKRKPTKKEARRRLRRLPDIPLPLRRLGPVGRGAGLVTAGAKALGELLITVDPLNRTAPRPVQPLQTTTIPAAAWGPSPIRWTPTPSFRQETIQEVPRVTPTEIIREVVNNPLIEITPEMLPIINDVAILMDSNGDLFENEFSEQFRRDKILPRKKRKKSKYQMELGRQLKMLKKKHPRTPITRLMKRAHRLTKKALK